MLKHTKGCIKYSLTVRNQKKINTSPKEWFWIMKNSGKNRLKPMKCFQNNNRRTKLQELMIDSPIASGCARILLILFKVIDS